MKNINEIKNLLRKMFETMTDKNIKSLSWFDYNINEDVNIRGNYISWGNCWYDTENDILSITLNEWENLDDIIIKLEKDLKVVEKIADKKSFKEVYFEVEGEIEELSKERNEIEKKWNDTYEKLLDFKNKWNEE